MEEITGKPKEDDMPGEYYEKNKDVLHMHFEHGSLSIDFARWIGAPNDEIADPSVLEQEDKPTEEENTEEKELTAELGITKKTEQTKKMIA